MKLNEALFKSQNKKSANGMMVNEGSEDGNESNMGNEDDKLFCGIFDRRKVLSLISSRGHCQRISSSQISNTPQVGFQSMQNLISDFVE